MSRKYVAAGKKRLSATLHSANNTLYCNEFNRIDLLFKSLQMEADPHRCLNCDALLNSAYCPDCGQKADTHRVTLSHLIRHDLVHGIWHFDKGLLFTLREAFLRPGYMAMDYIKGKRVKYYNLFYLILIVLGINVLVAHYFKLHYHIAEEEATPGLVIRQDTVDVSYYVKHYFKLLLFLMIPFFALCGLLSFRRLKLNFAEHAIIAGSLLLTGAMWYLIVIVGMYSSITIQSEAYNYIVWGFAILVCLQPVRVYYQAAYKQYSIGALLLHVLQWYAYLALLLYIVLLIIAAFTGKTHIALS